MILARIFILRCSLVGLKARKRTRVLSGCTTIPELRRAIILEYALESTALFNPSMVWHPDQSGLPAGSRRFILSLRATGEGHISSITFRTGVLDAVSRLTLETPTKFVTAPELVVNSMYDLELFERNLFEMGHSDEFTGLVLAGLNVQFTMEELKASIHVVEQQQHRKRDAAAILSYSNLLTLAKANYTAYYSEEVPLSERVLFPTSPTEINGIEDARFVQFVEEDGTSCFYATYTAYDGKRTMPQILKTVDFLQFEMSTLNGPEIENKGLALFPRKVKGQYAMLSRQDKENIFIMFSDNLNFWYTKEILLEPTFPWEYVQLGNCGSPMETPSGWLVLIHGVGAMRRYVIGAVLLDLEDPTQVIGRLKEPLITPDASLIGGYVPNVVYSCGSQIHNGDLVIPYAIADSYLTFAFVAVADILNAMEKSE